MRVLAACSLGGAGHLQPLLPFLDAARRRGDEVLVVGPPALGDQVDRAGFPFQPGGEPAEAEVAPIREQLPVASPIEASRLGNRELFGRLATDAMLPGMEAACRQWQPDLVLREPCEYSSAIVAADAGLSVAQVAISSARGEDWSIGMAGPVLEERRPGLVEMLRAMPYLTRFPRSLDPSPFRLTVRYREEASDPQPLPDWWPGRAGPLVYVTFGTVLGHMSIAAGVFRAVHDAVAAVSGTRVLLTVGTQFDAAELGSVSGNVHVEPWVDQAHVLPHADVVVCHGGSGTVLGGLGAGVPIVAVPLFADQSENARMVTDAGAGLVVRRAGGERPQFGPALGPEDGLGIRQAVEAVLADPGYRHAAEAVAAEMTADPPAALVLGDLLGPT